MCNKQGDNSWEHIALSLLYPQKEILVFGSVAKMCGHSPYTIPNILAFWVLGVICRLFSHWKYIFDVLCRAKNQTPGTRVKSVARFFVHVAERRTLSRTSLAVFIFLAFAGCCGTSSVSCLTAPNSRANIPRTLSCKCSDKHCDFNGAGFFLRIIIAEDNLLHIGWREGAQLIKESICPH